jgi:hypothetical protein
MDPMAEAYYAMMQAKRMADEALESASKRHARVGPPPSYPHPMHPLHLETPGDGPWSDDDDDDDDEEEWPHPHGHPHGRELYGRELEEYLDKKAMAKDNEVSHAEFQQLIDSIPLEHRSSTGDDVNEIVMVNTET